MARSGASVRQAKPLKTLRIIGSSFPTGERRKVRLCTKIPSRLRCNTHRGCDGAARFDRAHQHARLARDARMERGFASSRLRGKPCDRPPDVPDCRSAALTISAYGDLVLAWYRSGFTERGALNYSVNGPAYSRWYGTSVSSASTNRTPTASTTNAPRAVSVRAVGACIVAPEPSTGRCSQASRGLERDWPGRACQLEVRTKCRGVAMLARDEARTNHGAATRSTLARHRTADAPPDRADLVRSMARSMR